jgi:hypothetical protein
MGLFCCFLRRQVEVEFQKFIFILLFLVVFIHSFIFSLEYKLDGFYGGFWERRVNLRAM